MPTTTATDDARVDRVLGVVLQLAAELEREIRDRRQELLALERQRERLILGTRTVFAGD